MMKIERFEDIEAWQMVCELTRKARRTRAAVRGFINYLKKYEKRKPTVNRELDNRLPR